MEILYAIGKTATNDYLWHIMPALPDPRSYAGNGCLYRQTYEMGSSVSLVARASGVAASIQRLRNFGGAKLKPE